MLPFISIIKEKMNKFRMHTGVRTSPWPIFILGFMLLIVSFMFMPGVVSFALSFALFLAPIWLPLILVGGAGTLWVILQRSEFIAKQKMILLEIKPPRNVTKTPLAMEVVLSGMHLAPGEATWYKRYIVGSVRPWWSLEIVSIEGQVHFFVWTRAGFRRIIESNVYAQYPGAQITEAPDYTRLLSAKPDEWGVWGCDFINTAPDPLPIKTYVEYGLDKVQKEPEQVDPLANLIEFVGTMGKGENFWLQICIRVHKGEKYNKTGPDGRPYTWKNEAKELIAKIREETRDVVIDAVTGEERPGFPNATKGQMEKISAIERNISKLSFDVGIRCVYVATPEKFDKIVINGIMGLFKQFSSEGWNGIRPFGWMAIFDDYPWEIGASKMKDIVRRGLIDAYRRRQFFYDPYHTDTMILSTEELATIFHIPSLAVETPSLSRIQSATASAPSNLPI